MHLSLILSIFGLVLLAIGIAGKLTSPSAPSDTAVTLILPEIKQDLQAIRQKLDHPEWGPDGYGWQHLSKEDRLFVDRVASQIDPMVWNRPEAPFFVLSHLAYPQYRHHYQLTKEQWQSLQDFARLKLIDPSASQGVVAHWQSIVDGTVPFGLTVKE